MSEQPMKVRYRDGTEADDPLFDSPLDEQRAYVARAMGLHPGAPSSWPIGTIDHLLGLRQYEGAQRYFIEMERMLHPR